VEKRGKVQGGKKGRLWVGEGETVNEGNGEKGIGRRVKVGKRGDV
jgi:hypothetical protein